uniref:Uncharacterized protein n=1 Tax=Lotharella vacuolata TaxID=74820 RepID=A0A0H5BL22_9EUKA|nr:hypothetical protein [Lotharella vacuolata]
MKEKLINFDIFCINKITKESKKKILYLVLNNINSKLAKLNGILSDYYYADFKNLNYKLKKINFIKKYIKRLTHFYKKNLKIHITGFKKIPAKIPNLL